MPTQAVACCQGSCEMKLIQSKLILPKLINVAKECKTSAAVRKTEVVLVRQKMLFKATRDPWNALIQSVVALLYEHSFHFFQPSIDHWSERGQVRVLHGTCDAKPEVLLNHGPVLK